MMTDTEIRIKGTKILSQYLGDIEMERFIALIQREPFDYTRWRQTLENAESIETISSNAMKLRNNEQFDPRRFFGAAHESRQAVDDYLATLRDGWN